MNSCFESREVLWLRNEIERNKKYLATCTNKAQFQSIQAKTMYLKNEILPIVLNNTMIVHSEVQKYVMRAFDVAVQYNCNSLLLYLPINEEYTDKPIVGIANDKQLYRDWETDRKSTRLNSSHITRSRMPSSA